MQRKYFFVATCTVALLLTTGCASLANQTTPPPSVPTVAPATPRITPVSCDEQLTWNTHSKQYSRETALTPIVGVYVEPSACYDTVIVEIRGVVKPAHNVRYVPLDEPVSPSNSACAVGASIMEIMVSVPILGDMLRPREVVIEDPVVRGWNLVERICYAGSSKTNAKIFVQMADDHAFRIIPHQDIASGMSRLDVQIAR